MENLMQNLLSKIKSCSLLLALVGASWNCNTLTMDMTKNSTVRNIFSLSLPEYLLVSSIFYTGVKGFERAENKLESGAAVLTGLAAIVLGYVMVTYTGRPSVPASSKSNNSPKNYDNDNGTVNVTATAHRREKTLEVPKEIVNAMKTLKRRC